MKKTTAGSLAQIRLSRYLTGAVFICCLVLASRWLWTPAVNAIAPAELSNIEAIVIGPASDLLNPPLDFVFRPLLSKTRRPPEASTVSKSGPVAVEPEELVSDLDGHRLVGIFASGALEGAIIRGKNGVQSRLLVGEALDGWRLDKVGARSASFARSSGEVIGLTMALATLPPQIVAADPSQGAISSANAEKDGPAPMDADQPPALPTTFEEIWERRGAESASSRPAKSSRPANESGDTGQGRDTASDSQVKERRPTRLGRRRND